MLTCTTVMNILMTFTTVNSGHTESGRMANRPRAYSRLTREALVLLGKQIRLARKGRRMSEHDLAARVGIARSTLQRIEKGDPSVEIGLALEAATLAGVDLFAPEATTLAPRIGRVDDKLALMPGSIRKARREVDDDF